MLVTNIITLTKKAELSDKMREYVEYLENNWDGARFVQLVIEDDFYTFTFSLYDNNEVWDFLNIAHLEAVDFVFENEEDKPLISILLTM